MKIKRKENVEKLRDDKQEIEERKTINLTKNVKN